MSNEETVELCEGIDLSFYSFNEEKFKQILHYIIHNVGHLENVGKTVLYKILYFTEFNYYELYEEMLTGESYRKLPHGPAPCHFDQMITELQREGKIREIKTVFIKYPQQKYICDSMPDISLLNGKELDFINRNIAVYSNYNATQISEYSHKDIPYTATKNLEIIDYELVFYRDSLLSVREYNDSI